MAAVIFPLLFASGCNPMSGGQAGKWVVSSRADDRENREYTQLVSGYPTKFGGLVDGSQPKVLLLKIVVSTSQDNPDFSRFSVGGIDKKEESVFELIKSNLNKSGGGRYQLFTFDRNREIIVDYKGHEKKFRQGMKLEYNLEDVISPAKTESPANGETRSCNNS